MPTKPCDVYAFTSKEVARLGRVLELLMALDRSTSGVIGELLSKADTEVAAIRNEATRLASIAQK